jgi:outer membrane protein
MKNLSLIINAILVVLVGVLFWLHFKPSKSNEPFKQINFGDKNMKIAYVDLAKIDSNYKYIIEKKANLEKDLDKIRNSLAFTEQSLRTRRDKLQEEAYELENSTTMSMAQKYEKQNEFQAKYEAFQKDYAAFQENKDSQEKDLEKKYQEFDKEMNDNLLNNIKKYNLKQQYDYILTKQQMLFANDSLDITNDILTLLNEEFETSK